MRKVQLALPLLVLLCVAALPPVALAKGNGDSDRVQFFRSIRVGPNEEVGDLVCIGCSIQLEGTASGDVVAVLGSVMVSGTAEGDVVSVGGVVRLAEDAIVRGDAVGVGGGVSRHPNATVDGELVSQAGPAILFGLIFGAVIVPLAPIVLIIWLVVWLVRRDRPAPIQTMPYQR